MINKSIWQYDKENGIKCGMCVLYILTKYEIASNAIIVMRWQGTCYLIAFSVHEYNSLSIHILRSYVQVFRVVILKYFAKLERNSSRDIDFASMVAPILNETH